MTEIYDVRVVTYLYVLCMYVCLCLYKICLTIYVHPPTHPPTHTRRLGLDFREVERSHHRGEADEEQR
jgi:hypothetical protein